jgi:hypothetical protein
MVMEQLKVKCDLLLLIADYYYYYYYRNISLITDFML